MFRTLIQDTIGKDNYTNKQKNEQKYKRTAKFQILLPQIWQ